MLILRLCVEGVSPCLSLSMYASVCVCLSSAHVEVKFLQFELSARRFMDRKRSDGNGNLVPRPEL